MFWSKSSRKKISVIKTNGLAHALTGWNKISIEKAKAEAGLAKECSHLKIPYKTRSGDALYIMIGRLRGKSAARIVFPRRMWPSFDQKFPIGHFLVTPGAMKVLEDAEESPFTFLIRHAAGDWGEDDPHEWTGNEGALRRGGHLFSKYVTGSGEKIFVITKGKRRYTTITTPEEYAYETGLFDRNCF